MEKHPLITRIDLEPLGGIAGDMFAAAMFSGFPHLYKDFCDDLALLSIDGLSVNLEDRLSKGLQAKYFNVIQQTTQKPPRTLAAVRDFFNNVPVTKSVAHHAVGLFTKLAQAESEVHGKSLDSVHFHEVSDWDSVVDIVAAAGIIARLNCPAWRVGALPLGSGTVNTAHGDIPVPAPATLALLKGFQWQDDGVAGERVTPTGAAILSYLNASPVADVSAAATLKTYGSGCGTRELDGRANLLRMVAFSENEHQGELLQDEVVRIAFEVDDMTAEEIAWAADELRATAGVLDVNCVTMYGKKNRLSIGFRVIASVDQLQTVADQCFSVTSTIGIRYGAVTRFVLNRAEETVDTVSVKRVTRPDGVVTAKASSDDLASARSLAVRRQLAQSVCDAAMQKTSNEDTEETK